MSDSSPKKKKVVRSTSAPKTQRSTSSGDSERVWTPSPEAKKQATTFRIIALVLWAIAIAGEVVAIFWILPMFRTTDSALWWLIGALVLIAILAIAGSLLWKRANVLDPASKKDTFRFWVQNQLGLIIAILAFLPLIILIFMNKDMDGKQKGIAGGIAIVLLAVAAIFGIDFTPPSQEDYNEQTQVIIDLKGSDEVFWTTNGSVYHLCEAVSAVNQTSQDMTIHAGTVEQANHEGKPRLTKQVQSEMNQCGYEIPEDFDQILERLDALNEALEPQE